VFTGRDGGVSEAPRDSANIGAHVGDDPEAVAANRRRVAGLLELTPARVAGVTQVHGADVWLDLGQGRELGVEVRWDSDETARVEADALVTSRVGVGLAVGVADCLPIALVWGEAIAAIHAGWRGLEAGVIEATVAALRRAAGSAVARSDITPRAVLGPALGPCCFEVGEEVAARFDASAVVRRAGAVNPFLDVRADARRRLQAAGIEVDVIDVCTRCDAGLFSHRGDGGATGRQALLVARFGDALGVG